MGSGETLLLNGRIPGTIAGFRVYISQQLPSVFDAAVGTQAYSIIAGSSRATAFATTLEKSRLIDTDKDSWSRYYQGLMVYGYDVVRPEMIAHLYAYIA
jgi:hypothetical protein